MHRQDVGDLRDLGPAAGEPDGDGLLFPAPQPVPRQGDQSPLPEKLQPLQDIHGRAPILRNRDDTDAAFFDALLLPPLDLLPVLRPQVEHQLHAGIVLDRNA